MKYVVTLNGKQYEVEVDKTEAAIVAVNDAPVAAAAPVAATAPAAAPSPAPTAAPAVAGGTKILSPMPGSILSVNVSVGSSVKKGDVLLILEAMKMENEIVASVDGKIAQLTVQKGSTVNTDDVLAIIE